jgi:hypothetical protein
MMQTSEGRTVTSRCKPPGVRSGPHRICKTHWSGSARCKISDLHPPPPAGFWLCRAGDTRVSWSSAQPHPVLNDREALDHQQLPLAGCSDQRVAVEEPLTGPNLPCGGKGKYDLLVRGHLHYAARVVVPGRVVLPVEAKEDIPIGQGPDVAGHLSRVFPDLRAFGAIPDDLLRPFCRIQAARSLGGLCSGRRRLGQPQPTCQNQKQ